MQQFLFSLWVLESYLAKRDWYENAIWFQNPMNTSKHSHHLGGCFRIWIPRVTTVHEQDILQIWKYVYTWPVKSQRHPSKKSRLIFQSCKLKNMLQIITMVPFSITTSKHSLLNGRSSMSASSTLISDDRGSKERYTKI